jgi:hypothetical protein
MASGPSVTGGAAAKPRRRWLKKVVGVLVVGACVYLSIAYLYAPLRWRLFFHRHPALKDGENDWITHTKLGIPGDPMNVALVGTEEELQSAMLAAEWCPADPITLRSSLRIAAGTVFRRSYEEAPVSDLYFWDRTQDLAFEQQLGDDPRQRHHVRFWRSDKVDGEGRPLWIGAATLDTKVGLSRTTGQITHHIAAEVDPERDKIIDDLTAADRLVDVVWIDGFHARLEGRNGGGDPWHTDGRLAVGLLGPIAGP